MAENDRAPAEKVLVVVGDEGTRCSIEGFLKENGYRPHGATSGAEAITKLNQQRYALSLMDIDSCGAKGAEIVPKALEIDPDLAILVLSEVNDATNAAICLQLGAYEYLTKPVDLERMLATVERALRHRGTQLQTQEISAWLKQELVARTRELERERTKLEQVNVATLSVLINVLEAKYPDFVGHSVRVAEMSATIADEMRLPDDDIEAVRAAGRLHDIGRVGIRDAVLSKKGPLTPDEQKHIREQVTIGFQILSPLEHLGAARGYVRSHHEHWDGTGYPDGLKGEQIPVGARILCAAEIYDAITSPRPYQEKLSPEKALELMYRLAGQVLDRRVVDAVTRVVERHKMLVFVEGEQGR